MQLGEKRGERLDFGLGYWDGTGRVCCDGKICFTLKDRGGQLVVTDSMEA